MRAEIEVQAHQSNWPALQGSEKQVNWAADIRSRFAEEWEQIVDDQEERFGRGQEEKVAMLRQIVFELVSERSARRWIDLRFDDAQGILRSAIQNQQGRSR